MINKETVLKAMQCLEDNGIEKDECGTVLQALCYILLDTEIEEILSGSKEEIELKQGKAAASPQAEKIQAKIAPEMYLTCEKYNPYEYEEEMTEYIEHKGVITQEILLARKGADLPGGEPTVEAFVYADPDNEDYTNKYIIPARTDLL